MYIYKCHNIYIYIKKNIIYRVGQASNQRPNGIIEPCMVNHLINKSWKLHMLENVQAIDNDLERFSNRLGLCRSEHSVIYTYVRICISYPGHNIYIDMYNLLTHLRYPQLLITNTEHCLPKYFGVTSGNTNQESLLQKVSQLPVDFGHLFYWTLRNTWLWQEHHKL